MSEKNSGSGRQACRIRYLSFRRPLTIRDVFRKFIGTFDFSIYLRGKKKLVQSDILTEN